MNYKINSCWIQKLKLIPLLSKYKNNNKIRNNSYNNNNREKISNYSNNKERKIKGCQGKV